jgi:alpha,alpha-trehalase
MEIYELKELFESVQLNNVLSDGKTFPDCLPKGDLTTILNQFNQLKNDKNFDLKAFVLTHFDLPKSEFDDFKSDPNNPISAHIDALWPVLTRKPDDKATSSLIPLPHPYVVPGGRFREIYYWDSYFTMLGLRVSKRIDLIENMVDNFAYLLNTIGHIPNGNRTYYVGRSQPPFFAAMVQLLSEEKGHRTFIKYLPELQLEYRFWMQGNRNSSSEIHPKDRLIALEGHLCLNRYSDENCTPRPESYREDVEIAHKSAQKPENIYRNLRAAAESGWDFSSRWFAETNDLSTIETTDILPIDLNCLLYNLELTLSEAHDFNKRRADISDEEYYDLIYKDKPLEFTNYYWHRKEAINKYFWNEEKGFYFDYNFVKKQQTPHYTLAAAFPLFFKIATQEQAEKVAKILMDKFLKTGGLTTTLHETGQQWDAPNGWAPLQWVAYKGLCNYGLFDEANKIKSNWLSTNERIYKQTGKMMEKYNVADQNLEAGGGEYPLQDGFGWSNGVFLSMKYEV